MPILEITNTHLTQRCASCGGTSELALETLTPKDVDSGVAAGVLALPHCSCGAREFLIRSTDKEATERAQDTKPRLHRILVDGLLDALKTRGQQEPRGGQFVDEVSAAIGADTMAKWFPAGLKIAHDGQAAPPSTQEA